MRGLVSQIAVQSLELRPNPGPELLPPAPSWEIWLSLGLIGLVLGLSFAAIVFWLRRSHRLPPPKPQERALAELNRLESNGQDLEQRYVHAADILRRYLSARFQLPAPVRTTPEFLGVLQKSSDLNASQKTDVADILCKADLVKFARGAARENPALQSTTGWPTADEAVAALLSVRNLVLETASSER